MINIDKNIKQLARAFKSVLYSDDTRFLENMKENNLGGDDIRKYRYWEWTQGVGLYGFWKLYKHTGENIYLEELQRYYKARLQEGLPSKNINTVAPMLTMAFLYEETKDQEYKQVCHEWATWIMNDLPRTESGGFQHITSDTLNEQELWDDTLFMTVLFLAKMGELENNTAYIEEAKYQFLLHIKYLVDTKTGLWYHGWTFNGNHNFVNALWGRGNCWITIAIPELLSIITVEDSIKRFLVETYKKQVEELKKCQSPGGMWHTLIDDPTSYVEASATCGFAYGITKGCKEGLLPKEYLEVAQKTLVPIQELIDEKGVLGQVSYGTAMGRENKQFYKDIPIEPMPYGQALALLFLIEVKDFC